MTRLSAATVALAAAICLLALAAPAQAEQREVAQLDPVEIARGTNSPTWDGNDAFRVILFREFSLVCLQNIGTQRGGVHCWEAYAAPEEIKNLVRKAGHPVPDTPKGAGK